MLLPLIITNTSVVQKGTVVANSRLGASEGRGRRVGPESAQDSGVDDERGIFKEKEAYLKPNNPLVGQLVETGQEDYSR